MNFIQESDVETCFPLICLGCEKQKFEQKARGAITQIFDCLKI